jgi:hypothetical protein
VETVLILRAPVTSLQNPVTLLSEIGDPPQALFVLHPKLE